MPTFTTPGVYVEETRLAVRTIQATDTGIAAFVGMTAWGAIASAGPPLQSFGDYQRFHGPDADLRLGTGAILNHMAHAARAFFENGGSRLHIVRIPGTGAKAALWTAAGGTIALVARTPGGALLAGGDGNFRATFTILRTPVTKAQALRQPTGTLIEASGGSCVVDSGAVDPILAALADAATVTRVSLRVAIEAPGGTIQSYDDLGFDARHPRALQTMLGDGDPAADRLVQCVVDGTLDPAGLRDALDAAASVVLTSGSDGDGPPAPADWAAGMDRLRALDAVSTIAAPGSSALPGDTPQTVAAALVALAGEPDGDRFAVIDPPPGLTITDVAHYAQPFDTKNAAFYHPWIVSADPTGHATLALPPSGFICGIYRRNDIERGVWKAPANVTVSGALGLTGSVTQSQQEFLDPKGINCIRTLPARGIRVFGARTLSSDPEWKYVSQRRYMSYLQRSIDRGVAWAVLEPNAPPLWTALTASVADFLMREWRNGALLGAKTSDAFFVRCDRTTMTQSDLDQGRVVILIGVATVKPAEFVIFRIDMPTGTQSA